MNFTGYDLAQIQDPFDLAALLWNDEIRLFALLVERLDFYSK